MNSAGEGFVDRPTTLAEYQAIFRRRKWIIIALPLIAAVTAYVLSTMQPPLYKSNAEVLFNLSNIPSGVGGLSPGTLYGDTPTYLQTQASIARSELLAEKVVAASGVRVTASQFTGNSSASVQVATSNPVLGLSAFAANAGDAERLANAYADQFIRFKSKLVMSQIDGQLSKYRARLDSLRAHGQTPSTTYQVLLQKTLDLETEGGLLANNASVNQPAAGAGKVRPRPKRDGILGGLLGLAVGLGLAFLAEALDKRVRSEHEIEERLGVPLLGRVPRPTRRLRKANKLVMLAEPTSVHAQTFRRLRTSLEFVNFERHAKTILLTSALPREGKSTTVANLGVALARAGRRVALADLDLRRPFLHCFFNTRTDHGFTDVVVDRARLDHALRAVALPGTARPTPRPSSNGNFAAAGHNATNGRADVSSVLHVLPAGTIPPAADEFLETDGVGRTLEHLSEQFDVVLVDTPPLLAVGDVMTLSAKVDAIVVVTRLGIHRRQLEELARQLHTCRAPILGFILTGAPHGDSYSYGYGYDARVYEAREEAERVPEEAEH